MNYEKYIFDWENRLLERNEYLNTEKYAFSLLNKAQCLLKDHIDKYVMSNDEKENLKKVNDIVKRVYLETSHIEIEFTYDYTEKT